ncbi:hypothetical protein HB779_15835 [Phyllobacterium sp. 628]|uniref:ABZJ_00895 family protein n=1 Tax=Phyllobacterium sp. 628 TaxID=2718938 RepID=UPI0016623C8B|nr:ABZJ_00895 family protein [Phyllobacterium sp. 628]QND53199.1 hypothetical protein HB779_15835 [Phyllobacterium sp. 628]
MANGVDEPVPLGRYCWWFALSLAAATIVVAIGQFIYEAKVGPIPNSASVGLNIGVLFASAQITAMQFVKQQRRVPTRSERWRLAWVSLALYFAVILTLIAVLFCISLIYALGLVSPSMYWMAIQYMWEISGISGRFNDPVIWIVAVLGLVVTILGSLFIFHRCYGFMAEKFLTAQLKTKQSAP